MIKFAPKPIKVVGIDQSTSATGLVALLGSKTSLKLADEHLLKLPNKMSKASRYEKQFFMLSGIETFLTKHDDAVLVAIEDYGINLRRPGSIIPLAELGGVIRYYLHAGGRRYIDPKPTHVKQFITGKGSGDKKPMIAAVKKKWGYDPGDDNMVDAFALALMALAMKANFMGLTAEQRAVVGSLSLH